jgi:predicted Zn-dependent peptidase
MRGALVVLLLAVAMAATIVAAPVSKVQFSDTRLKNGLRVIIVEDHTAPVFSIAITYNVGSRNERAGRTGFAHLFEHMMFKGSASVGSGEHFMLVYNNGGDMNGSTSKDRTNYFERLPTNQLDLALFLESDRMRSLDITKENLQNQISTVKEERRQGVDNQPYGKTMEAFDDLAYENVNYKHSVIGSMADLDAATVEDVQAFFRTYYAPDNAALVIVGDVTPAACLAKVRQYFESIPSQPAPPEPDMTEPAQVKEKRLTIEDPLARATRIDIGYHIPSAASPDFDALSVLSSVLSSGTSSRFTQTIVRQKQLALQAFAGPMESRGPGLFRAIGILPPAPPRPAGDPAIGMPPPGKSAGDLEAAIYEEFEKVKTGKIEDWEIEKARNSARRSYLGGLTSSLQRAVMMSQYAIYYNDPNLINTRLDRLMAVTAADVQRVAVKYLTPENRTVIITVPKPAAATKGGK